MKGYKFLEFMKKHTSFNIGGPADCLVTPEGFEQLREIVLFCKERDFPITVIGNGTNLLVSDEGIPGVVIKLASNYSGFHFDFDNNILVAQAGSSLSILSKAAAEKGLSGLEFAIGIPGTVGGAVNMNAGAFGAEMKDIVSVVRQMNYEGENTVLDKSNLHFSYRDSNIKGIIYEVELTLKQGVPLEIKNKMHEYQQWRKERQPIEAKSAGSVFKKPSDGFAGQLIELAGLKGMSFGDAQISTKHANFIINKGKATASDVLYLIQHIQKVVFTEFGISLETEIDFHGFKGG